jgi:hypothetical protein
MVSKLEQTTTEKRPECLHRLGIPDDIEHLRTASAVGIFKMYRGESVDDARRKGEDAARSMEGSVERWEIEVALYQAARATKQAIGKDLEYFPEFKYEPEIEQKAKKIMAAATLNVEIKDIQLIVGMLKDGADVWRESDETMEKLKETKFSVIMRFPTGSEVFQLKEYDGIKRFYGEVQQLFAEVLAYFTNVLSIYRKEQAERISRLAEADATLKEMTELAKEAEKQLKKLRKANAKAHEEVQRGFVREKTKIAYVDAEEAFQKLENQFMSKIAVLQKISADAKIPYFPSITVEDVSEKKHITH